jgi:hypothetical protein
MTPLCTHYRGVLTSRSIVHQQVIFQNNFSRFPSVFIIGELRLPDDEYIQESQLYSGEYIGEWQPPIGNNYKYIYSNSTN